MRHFVTLFEISQQELHTILSLSQQMKQLLAAGRRPPWLARRVLAMLFEKPSLRTRVSFEAGILQLGGAAMFLGQEVGWQSRESTSDFIRVLAEYADVVVCRAKKHTSVEDLAGYDCVPIINGLTDLAHPCQALADIMTMQEIAGPLAGRTMTFVGDGNNVARSLALAAAMVGMRFRVLGPRDYFMDETWIKKIRSSYPHADIQQSTEAKIALSEADFVYTDVWTSMGQEQEAAERRSIFSQFQLNGHLMRHAPPKARVMHCLPAHRGEEITDEVIDSPQSAIVAQAGNRMHAQKGLLVWMGLQHDWLNAECLEQEGIELPLGFS
ncbi:MAG: ornithine carbamoyltransferase [Pirellulaceae bacterium]|nr:ornithine carbamoyltransferase [Pirellulaceae bacterium]